MSVHNSKLPADVRKYDIRQEVVDQQRNLRILHRWAGQVCLNDARAIRLAANRLMRDFSADTKDAKKRKKVDVVKLEKVASMLEKSDKLRTRAMDYFTEALAATAREKQLVDAMREQDDEAKLEAERSKNGVPQILPPPVADRDEVPDSPRHAVVLALRKKRGPRIVPPPPESAS